MCHRILMVAIVASLTPIAFSHAETAPAKPDPLKKLLEEKYLPPKSTTQSPPTVDKKDLHWIAPKTAPPAGKQGETTPARRLSAAGDTAGVFKPYSFLQRVVDNQSGGTLPSSTTDVLEFGLPSLRIQNEAPSKNIRVAQAPAAKRNSFIIQLRPTATQQQIDALLAKYGFRITGGQAAYHFLRVERNAAPAASGAPESLSDVLNQQIVRDLRRESIVALATVDTTVRQHSIPRASSTSVGGDAGTLNWTWKSIPSTVVLGSAGPNAPVPAPQADGNWGLKAIRVPPVWTIMQRFRDTKSNNARPKLAIIDTGFAKHEDLAFNLLNSPNQATPSSVASALIGSCGSAHGNHVAGIVGATHGNGIGIDGVIPQANFDAVPWSDVVIQNEDPGATSEETRTTYFSEALFAMMSYVESAAAAGNNLRVVNVSLGYNFGASPVTEGDPEKIAGLMDTIQAQAYGFVALAKKYENTILFVTAAGNDSTGRAAPYDAKWSSPIVWAATQLPVTRRPKNILIVEAFDRSGHRADFSNIGGHVAGPGVDIVSTLWPGENPYGACPGTSMASPHVAGVAALLFELDPSKKPAEIADIIKTSAIRQSKAPGTVLVPGAPRLDALEAVLRLSPDNLTRLADLNRDGKVDIEDMKIFAKHMTMIADNRAKGTTFTTDLNGDGVVDTTECNWPLIDLNGSGKASLALTDAKKVLGLYRTDLDVMALAWTDKIKDFTSALKETGLDVALQTADAPPGPSAAQACQ